MGNRDTAMEWQEGEIRGVVVRRAVRHTDPRGWLAEIFRADEIDADCMPAMSYVSVTHPGVTRGPHEHVTQTDLFAFMGPGDFRVKLWDNRPDSPTRGRTTSLIVGESNPTVVCVPPGIVHGYTNISAADAWVFNGPNRLFRGPGRNEPVDEIRHEDRPDSPFSMEEPTAP